MGWFEDKVDGFVDEQVDAMGAYVCTICGDEHVALELAFRWPDVAIRTSSATPEEPDDLLQLGGRAYVRGTLRVPIHGSARDFAVGLWLELDGPSEGRIANQLALLAPLLGARARVVAGPPGNRPTFELIEHPLAPLQRDGIAPTVADQWRSAEAHRGEPEAVGAPFRADLAVQGWQLLDAATVNRPRCKDPIAPGDYAKVMVQLTTIGEDGELAPFVAGWWIAVDHVADGRVSGTLHSNVPVPATVFTGTRMWPAADQIFGRQRV
jgi:hypothetical protein